MNHRRGLKSVPPAPTAVVAEEEDFELVRRFKHGGELAAFETLFRRHQQYVAGVCLSLLRSHAEAEDAVQEVFIKPIVDWRPSSRKSLFAAGCIGSRSIIVAICSISDCAAPKTRTKTCWPPSPFCPNRNRGWWRR